MVLVLAVALLWFQVPLRGSVSLLMALTLVYLLTTLGLGLFVSTISSTQQQAMITVMFETLWPEALGLTAWGLGILALAIARSTKRTA